MNVERLALKARAVALAAAAGTRAGRSVFVAGFAAVSKAAAQESRTVYNTVYIAETCRMLTDAELADAVAAKRTMFARRSDTELNQLYAAFATSHFHTDYARDMLRKLRDELIARGLY